MKQLMILAMLAMTSTSAFADCKIGQACDSEKECLAFNKPDQTYKFVGGKCLGQDKGLVGQSATGCGEASDVSRNQGKDTGGGNTVQPTSGSRGV